MMNEKPTKYNARAPRRIRMITSLGAVEIELYSDKAPLSTANFLNYAGKDLYNGSTFFRILNEHNQPGTDIKINVIQGGPKNDDPRLLAPVEHESTAHTGLTHKDGTVSMARWGAAGSAQASFFICIHDQPALDFGGARNPDGQGFAAFGQVTSGMDVVRKIWAKAGTWEYVTPEILIDKVEVLT
jgi:peptidyl-prolyl cis-trans isomerase A (cyclophilin A)